MKKIVALLLAACMVLCMGAVAFAEDASLTAITEKGKFILGLDDGFPPMGYRNDNNEIVGFDIDLATEVCARLGVELVLQPIDWAAKELELQSGNIDCIWNGMSITEERQKNMELSDAYLNNKIVLVVKADAGYQGKDDLKGKKIGVQSRSFAEEVLETYPEHAEFYASLTETLRYEEYLMALMDLQNDNTDGVLIDVVVAEYMLQNMEDNNLVILDDNFGDDLYAIGFRKGDVALRDAVNATLVEMKKDGKVGEICSKWFGSDISLISAE